ncbi:MAG: HIRAN domain-containing protein [Paludibacteraceae bacterium]|nr:HIRAN domain-containing protein [Paludibacteraceae bacterium]
MKAKNLFFQECRVAGRRYSDADLVWDKLKVGTPLRLARDMDNKYDPNAVAIMFDMPIKGTDKVEPYLLGYIPRAENYELAMILESGWTEIFNCIVSRIDEDADFEHQILITIRVNRKEQEKKDK